MLSLLFFHFRAFPTQPSSDERSFLLWMRNHNLLYSGTEYHSRLQTYLSNLAYVRSHNSRSTFSLTLNRFAAMTLSEYRALLSHPAPAQQSQSYRRPRVLAVPSFRNWTKNLADKGIFFPVRDGAAGKCSSDWAFAAVESVQYAWAVFQGPLPGTALNLSAAFLLDCADSAYGCYGCYGGSLAGAYRWVIEKQEGRFFNDTTWPYDPENRGCAIEGKTFARARITDWWVIYPYSEADLSAQCEALGAVAAGIDASRPSFAFYKSGIYEEPECSPYNVNHGVTVVGFGSEPKKYWIVKNSWGQDWGEGGYMRLLWDRNHCGIATVAVAPVC
jgi:hypothetical protein